MDLLDQILLFIISLIANLFSALAGGVVAVAVWQALGSV